MRVFIAGGTGLIGSPLIATLHHRGDQIVLLTRRKMVAQQKFGNLAEVIEGDPTRPGPWMDQLPACDAVINLTGENIFDRRWNAAFKQALWDSRILSTRYVVEALSRHPLTSAGQPKILVNASAIGYYASRGDEVLTEESAPGDDFLARLCVEWETTARVAEQSGVRVCLPRVGVVLDKAGGALAKLLTPFKLFVGGKAGSGKQWMSWIHHADMVGLLQFALDNGQLRGPFNCSAPNPVTNKEFSTALGEALHRPSVAPVPGFMLKVRFGEVAELILGSQRVLPRKALDLGYRFQFPDIGPALADAVR